MLLLYKDLRKWDRISDRYKKRKSVETVNRSIDVFQSSGNSQIEHDGGNVRDNAFLRLKVKQTVSAS